MKFMIEAFETHNKLNPRLFNNSTMTMRNEVRERLLEIADKFVENLKENDVPLKVVDYWVVGSNAAYNYNDQSDIDVHIIVNMEDIDAPSNILTILYNYAKSDFNSDYDITIRGQEVELYIEDVNTSAVSNGIYSLKKNEWIKKPEPLKETSTDVTLDNLYKEWEDRFEVDIESDNVEQLQEFVDDLYILRKSSLMSEGEFGTGNLVFKELRNQGKLQQIKDKIKEVESKELTLENLNKTNKKENIVEEIEKDSYKEIDADEMISGMMDNASNDDIDSTLRYLQKAARLLGIKDYNLMKVLVVDIYSTLNDVAGPRGKKGLAYNNLDGVTFVKDTSSKNYVYLYFRNEEERAKFLEIADTKDGWGDTAVKLREKQESTVYNALAAYPRYKEKYGKLDAFFELKYNFRLTPEECLFIINKVFEKGYIDEYTKDEAIKYLKLNEN